VAGLQKRENSMADMFLSLRNNNNQQVIDGESLDVAEPHSHVDEIEVLWWSWTVGNTADDAVTPKNNQTVTPPSSKSKINVKNIIIYKYCDKASKGLLQYCVQGSPIHRAKITCRKHFGEERYEYLHIHLEDVKIFEIDWEGRDETGIVKEKVTLQFGKFQLGYRMQPNKEDHNAVEAWSEFGWDIQNNHSVILSS
jgi:type VI protein secretion system component Hcp